MNQVAMRSLGAEMETTLQLLYDLVTELQRVGTAEGSMARVQEIVSALERRPNLQRLPNIMLSVYSEIMEALHGIRLTRETIQAYSVDRIRDTHARLSEVSSATESAALEMLNGLDRTISMIDQLEQTGGTSVGDTCTSLRNEVNNLYGTLQFQDIISQQLHGVTALLAEVEQRMETVASLFDGTGNVNTVAAAATVAGLPDPQSYNPDASTRGVGERQAAIDEAFSAARGAAA